MCSIRSYYILFFVCISFVSNAQILKVNKGSLVSDSSNYFIGVVDATFALNNRSATADKRNLYLGINNNIDVLYISEQSATLLISGLNYYKIGGGPLIYNGSFHLRQIVKRAARWTPEIFTQTQFDESRNMELRQLLGGGVRWNLLQRKNILYMGLGGFYEYERWKGENELIRKKLFKFNSYLSGDIRLSETTYLNTIFYFQSGWDNEIASLRNRVSGQLEIKNEVTDKIKVKLTSNVLLDDKPIILLNELIYEVFFGVGYNFN